MTLYSYLLGVEPAEHPECIGVAMREARKSIVGTLTWGAYQRYGNYAFRLLRE